jgi:hypothetical protein
MPLTPLERCVGFLLPLGFNDCFHDDSLLQCDPSRRGPDGCDALLLSLNHREPAAASRRFPAPN